ncbi:MAG: hypothetical protein IMF19_07645 [Proteobacteria bacterium]|nr:hypothetical protein [Pseudomonadota bacterium]
MVSLKSIKNWIANPFVVALIIALIPSGIIVSLIMQPNVVYEKLPTYQIAETNDTHVRSVTCVILKNTGHAPANNIVFAIGSSTFFPELIDIDPPIWHEYCRERESKIRNQKVYSLEEFADGASFTLHISSQIKNPDITIEGIHSGGNKIEMEKHTFPIEVILIGLLSYIIGLSTCSLFKLYSRSKKNDE